MRTTSPFKLYVNGRFLTQPMTGVERYAYQMCRTLANQGQPFTIVCPRADIQACYDTNGLDIVHYGHSRSHLWEQCVLPFFFLSKRNYLLVSFTGLGSILVGSKVMTIHDLAFLENPSWYSRTYYWWYRLMTPLAVRTSRRIITVSQFSRQQIQRNYRFLPETHITVIPSAVDMETFKPETTVNADTPRQNDAENFVLAVSSIDPRKNFARLIEAFKGIKDCQLRIVGKCNRVFSQQTGLDQQLPENIRFLGRVSDKELNQLYSQAACFVFPSVYEGFGLPPLEAMTRGCPVLASDIPVIREVCADAAIYFDPFDTESIRATIQHYLEHADKLRPTLQNCGRANARRFSWQTSAQAAIQLFHETVNIKNKQTTAE